MDFSISISDTQATAATRNEHDVKNRTNVLFVLNFYSVSAIIRTRDIQRTRGNMDT